VVGIDRRGIYLHHGILVVKTPGGLRTVRVNPTVGACNADQIVIRNRKDTFLVIPHIHRARVGSMVGTGGIQVQTIVGSVTVSGVNTRTVCLLADVVPAVKTQIVWPNK
jgi:hypothetical protein